AVGVANPDVVVGGAAVALAKGSARTADVGNLVPFGRENAFLAFTGADAADPAALGRHRIQLQTGGEGDAARGLEKDLFAIRRPARDAIEGGIEGEAARAAALDRDDERGVAGVAGGRGSRGAGVGEG